MTRPHMPRRPGDRRGGPPGARPAAGVLVGCVLLALAFSAYLAGAVPPGQPYDEPSHFGTVLQYAHGHLLPVLGDKGVTYEAQMGPVYYLLSALPAGLVGDADRHVLALHVLRFGWLLLLPILAGLTFALSRRVGARPIAAAVCAGLVVLDPTMVAIGASVQNDYLCITFAAVASLTGMAALAPRAPVRLSVVAGALIGIAILTKLFAGALLVGFLVAALSDLRCPWAVRRRRSLAAAGATVLVCGWWFVRNLALYGDLTGAGGVRRTGASFPPLQFTGVRSVADWLRSLISYGFAPTEYYRNAFHAPPLVRAAAVLATIGAVVVVAAALARTLDRRRATGWWRDPVVVFAVVSVMVTVLGYAIAAWTMQAIAPRLTFVAAPLGAALLARATAARSVRILLGALLVCFVALDGWLVVAVHGLRAVPQLWPG